MRHSEITLRDAIERADVFYPVKIVFNGIVLYNDYDGDEDGENKVPLDIVPKRIWQFDKYIVTSMNIEIVEFHHSILTIQGEYRENNGLVI